MNDITYVEHFPVILPTEKYQDLSNKHLQRRSTIIKITAGISLLKVNNRNTRTRFEICVK